MYIIGVVVRLVGGNSYNEGRVEINYNGEWGTVCDDGWNDTDAGVVCRQLGFGSSGTSYSNAYFGEGSGSIWLDNIECTGNETTLASCGHLGLMITRNCSHSEDAGVKCYGEQGSYSAIIFNKLASFVQSYIHMDIVIYVYIWIFLSILTEVSDYIHTYFSIHV